MFACSSAQRTRTTASATTDSETLTVAPSTPPPANIGFLPAIFGVSLPVVQAGSQSYVKMKLPVSSRSTVGLTLLAEAVGNPELAVYWREGTEPTHTRYNFTEAFGQAAKYDVNEAVFPVSRLKCLCVLPVRCRKSSSLLPKC